jgi:hypothetical protein
MVKSKLLMVANLVNVGSGESMIGFDLDQLLHVIENNAVNINSAVAKKRH